MKSAMSHAAGIYAYVHNRIVPLASLLHSSQASPVNNINNHYITFQLRLAAPLHGSILHTTTPAK